ncbi:MAG: hypothetical protein JST00_20755 [Deltaproteobacteria bacterium]|nr:hypothetical protein [Deltaproteobacteria bacterium]
MHLTDRLAKLLTPSTLGLSACAGLGLALAAVACSAPTIPNEVQEPEDTESGSTTKKPSTKNTPDSGKTTGRRDSGGEEEEEPLPPDTDGGATPPTTSCTSSTSYDACYQCCDPTNAVQPAIDVFGKCVCQSPGTCAAQCGSSYCNGQPPSPACETCLNAATACEAKADAACGTACKAALSCAQTSKCDEKP